MQRAPETISIRPYWPSVERQGKGRSRPVVTPSFCRSQKAQRAQRRWNLPAGAAFILALFAGGLAVAQTAGLPLPTLAPSATLDLQPLFPGRSAEVERRTAAGLEGIGIVFSLTVTSSDWRRKSRQYSRYLLFRSRSARTRPNPKM